MKVVEIFNSIEGEGKRAGIPCTFIRLYGCNAKCEYCDSTYAWALDNYEILTIDEILYFVNEIGCPNVTVTGGEPLIHNGIEYLLNALVSNGYDVNVETNGTRVPSFWHRNLFYTMDYKTNVSGMTHLMNLKAFSELSGDDVIKFVVGSQDDLVQALEFLESHTVQAQIFVSPVFGKIEPVEIVNFIKEHKLWHWKTQLQLHKYIWNPEERGV